MVLFIKLPPIFKKQISYEISDVYVMALTFITVFYATKLTQDVIRKKMSKNSSTNTSIIFNRGGGNGRPYDVLTNDNEITQAILYCVRDDSTYQVLDSRIISLVLRMSGQKLKGQLVTITPNLIRVFAQLSYRNPTIITKAGNFMMSTSNYGVLKARMLAATIAAIGVRVFNLGLLYAILMMTMTYEQTSYIPCERYFEQLPKTQEKVIDLIVEDRNKEIVLVTASESEQIQVFTPDKNLIKDEKTDSYLTRYKKSKRKAKRVNFSDFKKTDPVLSQFPEETLEEFEVPQRKNVQETIAEIIDVMIE